MLKFPCAKINIGLYVTEKRSDGFHNIETIFCKTQCCDALEVHQSNTFSLNVYPDNITILQEENLVFKAYTLLQKEYTLPPVKVNLIKQIPSGAGLGGGSSDAAQMLLALNDYFNLNIPLQTLQNMAFKLGSDVPFFMSPNNAIGKGKGEILQELPKRNETYILTLIKPKESIDTAWAYQQIKPKAIHFDLEKIYFSDIHTWKDSLSNDFEKKAFGKWSKLQKIKEKLYTEGAIYASMSGSGSCIFGLFCYKSNALSGLQTWAKNNSFFYHQSYVEL